MSFPEMMLALLGFILVVNSATSKRESQKTTKIIKIIVGIFVLLFTLWSYHINSQAINELGITNDTLKLNSRELLAKRMIDSSNNAGFQKYLRDTFGIERQNNTAMVIDTKIFHAKATQVSGIQQKSINTELQDSVNYDVKLINNTLIISPKQGTWSHGFFAFDTLNGIQFNEMLTEGMGTPNLVDKIKINKRIYNTHIFKIYDRPVYMDGPIKLNLSSDLNRYIIFGDQGYPSKRYIYKQGKVSWIPER